MANNVQYTIGFNADISQAKKEVESLVASLQKVSKMSLDTPIKDSSIKAASDAAQELQKHLQAAIDVNTGKLNLNTFNNSLKNANMSVSQLGASLLEAGEGGKTAFMQLANSIANAEVPIKRMNSTLSKWGTTLKNTVKWEISSNVIHGLESALSGAVSYVKNLNSSLNDIRIVTGYSADDMTRFAQQANKAAKELSTTTKAYTDASLIYFQQGDAAEMVAKKAAITTKAANVAFSASAEEMSEMLTAVWNSYQVGEKELEKYVDIMAALGAATATSTEEIATAMQKVAATANTVGVSMQQMSSIIATVSSVTREAPESIGTSFKTILARMGDLKIGKTLEDGMSLGTVSSQLAAVGVNILDTTGELKDMGGVIEELMGKWQGMTSAEKTAVAQAVAGKRQYTQLMALMENQDMYQKSMGIAENAEGTLQEQADIYAESWEGASKRVQAALEGIYSQLIDDKALVSLLKFSENFINTISGAIKAFGGLGGIVANIGGLFAQYFSADIAAGLIKGIANIKKSFTDLRSQQVAFLDNQKSFRDEISKLAENELLADSDRNQLASIQKISEAKSTMLEKSKFLTDEQRTAIEGVIAAYQNQVEAIRQVQAQYDSLQKSVNDQEEQLTNQILLEEAKNVASKKQRNYFEGDNKQRQADWLQAKKDIVTDASINIEITNADGAKRQIDNVIDAYKELGLIAEGIDQDLTFDDVIGSAKNFNTALGDTQSVLQQLNRLGNADNGGTNLFASGVSSIENVTADLQQVYNEYVAIVDLLGQENKLNFSFDTNLTEIQLQDKFKQLQREMNNLFEDVSSKTPQIREVLLQMIPPELSSQFKKLFQEWEESGKRGLNVPQTIKEAWEQASNSMTEAINKAVSTSQKKLQGLIQIASSLTQLTASIRSILNAFKSLSDPDVSGWEKFGAVVTIVSSALMSIKSVVTAFSVVQAAYNGLLLLGATANGAEAAAIANNTREVNKNTGAKAANAAVTKAIQNAGGGLLGTLKLLAAGFKKFWLNALAPALSAAAPFLAIAAAIGAISYAIIKYSAREKEWAEQSKKNAEQITKNINKNKENQKKLTSNMNSLSEIMNDTNLAYDDQISKINEIVGAYGIQVSAVDELDQSYTNLKNTLIETAQAQGQINMNVAQQNAQEAQDNTETHAMRLSTNGDTAAYDIGEDWIRYLYFSKDMDSYDRASVPKINLLDYEAVKAAFKESTFDQRMDILDDDQIKYQAFSKAIQNGPESYYKLFAQKFLLDDYESLAAINSADDVIQAWKQSHNGNGNAFVNLNSSNTAAASLLNKSLWAKGENWAYDKNYRGIRDKGYLNDENAYSTPEGQFITGDKFSKILQQYGFYFDKSEASLNSIVGMDQNYIGLYKFLTTDSSVASFLNDSDSYLSQLLDVLNTIQTETALNAQQQLASTQANNNLNKNENYQKTVFGNIIQDVKTVQSIINDSLEGIDLLYQNETREDLLSSLLQNSNYSNAAKIIQQEYTLADQVIKIHPELELTPETEEQIRQQIVQEIQKKYPEIDIETLINLSAKDINLDFDEDKINISIESEIDSYINKMSEYNKLQQRQKLLKDNKELLEKDSFDSADKTTIESLKNQGLFGKYFNTDNFMKMSPSSRVAFLEQLADEQNNELLKILSQNNQESLIEITKEQLKSQEDKFNKEVKFLETDKGINYIDEKSRQVELASQYQIGDQALIKYDEKTDDEKKKYDWADILKQLGVQIEEETDTKGDAGKTLVDSQLDVITNESKAIEANIGYIKVLEEGVATTKGSLDRLNQSIRDREYNQWLQNVSKQTRIATNATEALGKRGQLTAEQLANLSIDFGKNIYSQYQNLSDNEWNQYIYENAMAAYDKLYKLQQDDLAAQAEILQEKKQLEAEYWDETAAIRDKNYNDNIKRYEKELERQKDATNAMQSSLATGLVTSSQQQAIAKLGYNWQFGDNQMAIRDRLSSYGAGLLNQTMAQLNINNTKRGVSSQNLNLLLDNSYTNYDLVGGNKKFKRISIDESRRKELTEAINSGEDSIKAYFEELREAGIEIDTATANILTEMAANNKGKGLSYQDILVEYDKMIADIDNDNSELWSNFEDGAMSAITSVIDAETEAADKVFSVWETTYKAIADARFGLANGQSVAESMLGDIDSQATLVKNLILNNSNITNEEIIKALHATSETDAGALVTPTKLSMTDYGASRGVISAILTEEEAKTLGNGYNAGDILEDQAKYQQITIARLTGYESEFKEQLNQNEEMQAAYTEWLKVNNKTLDDMSSETILEYLKQEYGLDETKIGETFATERGTEIVYVNNQQAQDITDVYSRAKAEYNTAYEKSSQQLSDWQAIYNASLQSDKGTISEILGDSAAEIAARLGYKDVKSLDMISSDYAKSQISNAQVSIDQAQVTFGEAVDSLKSSYGEKTVSSVLGKTLINDTETVNTNAAAVTEQVEAITSGRTALETYANSLGVSENELNAFTQDLINNGKIVGGNADEQIKAAAAIMRQNKGYTAVKTSLKGYMKELSKAVKNSNAYYSTIENIRSIYGDVFDLTKDGMRNLSTDLLENANNAKLLEQAAKGDAAAFDELQGIVAKDLVQDVKINIDKSELDALIDEIAVYDFGDIKIGADLDDTPFYDKLNSMVLASSESAQAMSDALSSMGVDATIEKHEVWVPDNPDTITFNGQVPIIGPDGVRGYENVSSSITQSGTGHMETWYTIQGAKYNGKGISSGVANRAKGSGGGGGGGKAKKIDKKEPEDEKERYHHINKVLDRLSNQFDEIDKKKSRVYGKSYLDYISQEIDLTEKQCDAYQRYIDEAKEYLALDTQRVASLGATFDEFGNIENYDQVMDNIIGKYNEFVDRYNAMSASEQEAAEEEKTKWDEWYDEKKKWIENYEETVSTIYEQQNNLLEAQNKISEKTLEGIQYKVEIHVDITDAEKNFLDYLNDTYDELLEKQGNVMNNLVRETELATSNLDALGRSKEELDATFESGKLNQADYVDGLKDVNEQILDNLSNIQDLKKEIEELYGDTLEMASDAFDEQTEKVKNASDAMSSYISILGLIGKGSNLKELTKFYESQYEYNLQSLEMQKEYLDILRSEEQYYLERMNSAEGLTETERQQYEDLEKTIADVNSNILSDTESTLNQIAEAFNNEIEIIFKDLEERIAGVGNSIQDLADAYSYYQEEQSRYVTSARELYEVNKLNRQIEKTMNETSSKVNKNLLAALQDRINKQSELNELTEYDIEMNQLQYELLLKKIALEEAQNAKSTVRLTRDSGGNYVYQYTADQDDIATKQQEYEDVLQQINDLSVNRVQDLESQLLEIYQNTLSKIKEIAQDQTLTEEEKYDKIQTIMNQFKEQTNFIQQQYQIASDNLITSNLAISEHYGQQLVEHSENAKNGLNQTIAAMIENTENLQQALEDACANQIPAAMDAMQSRIDAVTAAINLDYNSISESVTNYNKVTKDAYDQTNKTADNLSKELLPAIHNATTAWDTYVNKLKNVIDTYESMYQTILKTIQAQAKLSNTTAPSTVKSSGSGKFSDTTSPSANGNSGAGVGSGGGSGSGGSGGTTSSNAQYTFITYKTTVRGGKSTTSGGLPTGPNKLAVGSTGLINYNPSPNFIKVGHLISDPSKLSITGRTITALAAGSVVVTVQYQPSTSDNSGNGRTGVGDSTNNLIEKIAFATGGLADFTGPAWMDGSKSRPEMVLNPEDTKNILTAVQGVRALDASTLNTLNKYIANASLAMTFGLGNISAGSVYGATDTIQQEVHITAEFPNATNSAEIQDAFDNIINRATQYITTKR